MTLCVFVLGYAQAGLWVVNRFAISSQVFFFILLFAPLLDKQCTRVVDVRHRGLVCSALATVVAIQLMTLSVMVWVGMSDSLWIAVGSGQLVTVCTLMGFHGVLKFAGSDA